MVSHPTAGALHCLGQAFYNRLSSFSVNLSVSTIFYRYLSFSGLAHISFWSSFAGNNAFWPRVLRQRCTFTTFFSEVLRFGSLRYLLPKTDCGEKQNCVIIQDEKSHVLGMQPKSSPPIKKSISDGFWVKNTCHFRKKSQKRVYLYRRTCRVRYGASSSC